MKNNKGITIMSLIITIVVMLILISIVGYFSIDSIKNTHMANDKKEMADIVQYVAAKKTKLLINEFDVEDEYADSVITSESLYLIASGLDEDIANKIIEVNTADNLDYNYKYIYIPAGRFNAQSAINEDIVVRDVKNNYIINFYTGTIIGLYDNGERFEISGSIKSLSEILNDIY